VQLLLCAIAGAGLVALGHASTIPVCYCWLSCCRGESIVCVGWAWAMDQCPGDASKAHPHTAQLVCLASCSLGSLLRLGDGVGFVCGASPNEDVALCVWCPLEDHFVSH
jgi:hypothetical protein